MCRRRARAFLCPALSHRLHFLFVVLRQGRRWPFPLPHGPAPPVLFLARRFLPADFPDRHPGRGCTQMSRRSYGLSCRLQAATLLLDGPLRRPLRRYTAHAGGSATPVATAPSLPISRITLSP